MTINIKTFFAQNSGAFTHVVSDVSTGQTAIIDSVLDYDPCLGRTDTKSADELIDYVKAQRLSIEWILETHTHVDHITAAHYLKERLGGKIGIGEKIKDLITFWVPIFNTARDTTLHGFDHLFKDGEVLKLGRSEIHVWYTPGHTPACISYLIDDVIFVGDTLLMPDIGTGRTDFPGGEASALYDSIQKILSLPDDTRIFICHDYPPQGRDIRWACTVKEQKEKNVLVQMGVTKETYVKTRNQMDDGKLPPKLMLPAIQTNLRAGSLGAPEENGVRYIKIPVDMI